MAYCREDIYDEKTTAEIARHYREILRLIGEDPEREGLVKTPERVAKALQFLTKGKAHVAYIPDGTITGLSKIARVVETYARRLQVQERLTVQIRDCIQKTLNPMGVAVVIEAAHTCMQIRGVEKSNAVTVTSAFSGVFLKDERTRNEFLNLIRH